MSRKWILLSLVRTLSFCSSSRFRQLTEEEVKQMLDRRISLLLSVPLYTSTNRCGFLQTAFSVEMLRHRCPVRLFSITNGFGISQCKTATRFHTKQLAREHDGQVKQWRDEIQVRTGISSHACRPQSGIEMSNTASHTTFPCADDQQDTVLP